MSGFFLRLAFSIAALIIMLVAAVIALGYFAYALFVYLEGQMSPPLAAVVTGILVLLLAAFLVLATRAVSGRHRARDRAARQSAADFGDKIGRGLFGSADAHKTGPFLAALVTGLAFGVSPKLREFLLDILKR